MSESGTSDPAGRTPSEQAIAAMSVDALIERFGGIRPMASKLDVPVTTVQGWKERAAIPERRWSDIAAAAERHGIALTGEAPAANPSAVPAPETPWEAARPADPPRMTGSTGAPRRSRRAYWIGAGLVALAAIAVFGGPALKERWHSLLSREASAPPPEAQKLEEPTTESKAADASARPAPQASADASAAMAGRIATLETRLAAADDTAAAALKAENRRLNDELDQLRGRLAAMEKERLSRREERERAQTLFMNLGQLRAALAGPTPYAAQLELLESAAGKDAKVTAILETLRPNADRGAPTRAMLAQRFDSMAAAVVRAGQPRGDTWRDRLVQQIESLVVVRRTGPNAPEGSTDAILARADNALSAGDVAAAVAALEQLQGPALSAAEPWLADARARLSADRALLALEARTFAVLIGSDGGKAP